MLKEPEIDHEKDRIGQGTTQKNAGSEWIQLCPHGGGATDFEYCEADNKGRQNTAPHPLHHLGGPQYKSDGVEPETGEELPEDGDDHGSASRESHGAAGWIDEIR